MCSSVYVNDRNNTYVVGTEDGVFASPQVVTMPDDAACDPELLKKVKVRHRDFISDGVKPPPAWWQRGRLAAMRILR